MASNETQNFHLNQWSLSDDVRMEDFNADNLKLETALSAACRCVTGSYVGTGEYGAEHPNTLTFDFTPYLVILHNEPQSSVWGQIIALRPSLLIPMLFSSSNAVKYGEVTASWNTTSLSWYGNHEFQQMNESGVTYHYTAFGLPAAQP